MNVTAHEHTARLETYDKGLNAWNVRYGDTKVWVYPWPLSWLMLRRSPSARRLSYITRKAIRRHDRGSIKAGRREQRKDLGFQRMQTARSDWWMDSQERMDKIHTDALIENRMRETLVDSQGDPGLLLGRELPGGRHVVRVEGTYDGEIRIEDDWGVRFTVGPHGELVVL